LSSRRPLNRARILNTLIDNLDGMVYRCLLDADWRMLFVSQGCLSLTGYTAEELVRDGGASWESLTHPEDRVRVRSQIHEAVRAGRRFVMEYRIVTRSGQIKWIAERGIAVADEEGQTVIEGFMSDVTAQRETLQALQHAELRYRNIFEHACEGIFQTTPEGRYLAANPALARLYGYASPQALIDGLCDIGRQLYVQPGRREQFLRLMAQQGAVSNFESEVYRADGSRIWISENAHAVRDAQGRLLYYEGTVQDISERRNHQKQLEHQASHDPLTGLPNRMLLCDRIEQGLARAARLGYFLAVALIDLDGFKLINDSLGHAAGDELLREVAARLRNSVRLSDTVARLGGDEFVLVLNDHYRIPTVALQLQRVLGAIAHPLQLAGQTFQLSASLGVALYPSDSADAATLLRYADMAMYAAKAQGRNGFQFYTAELNRQTAERLELEAALREAIEREELDVHYQPKVDHHYRVVGAEALARWHHPELGTVRPGRFIAVAEETGLIQPLTRLVLRRALAAARSWADRTHQPLHVAVNLSPRLFQKGDIVTEVAQALQDSRLEPRRLQLEITENVLVDNGERAVQTLHRLKALGVHLAMDDFGTGYSSLSYLHRLPLDIVKLDRSLVTGSEHKENVAMIAQAVISLVQRLGKTVVAEGVENQAQFDFLSHQGCHEFQGHLIARPMPDAEFMAWLRQNTPPSVSSSLPPPRKAPWRLKPC